ncbi:MAG: hypothetical protein IT169_14195 [Bryobacterales bacterium]|nr:hypothetical protein [Bryobacterales bacterium]
MMKFVQLGILAALVLVAVLLGLNLMQDRATPPAETAAAVATPLPPEAAPAGTGASTNSSAAPPSAAPAPQQPVVETIHAPAATAEHRPTAPKPATSSKPAVASKPSPAGAKSSSRTAPAAPAVAHQEVARVDPPSAMPETHSAPTPPAPATPSHTERYELMRPESTASHAAGAHVAPARTVTIPAGTILTIRTIQALSTKSNAAGDAFSGTLDQPLVVDDMVIAERGARVEGKVMDVTESGRVKGVAQMAVALTRLNTSDGQTVDIGTQYFVVEAEKSTKSDATKVGIATGIGAALGAIFGGGKGAAIGAATGGAAGAGTVLVTKGKPAEIPSETRINFRLDKPLVITEKINTK